MRGIGLACGLALGLVAAPAGATEDDLRSVAGMQNHERVLLVFAPSLRDPRLERQRQVMARFAAEAADRDLAFVQVAEDRVIGAHDAAQTLLRRFPGDAARFRALLIGKDGQVSLTSAEPLTAERLAQAIDAMPMRQEEVRRARSGLGSPGR